ncbi:MAG: SRPBCC domain-containing protein [Candidatus Acidiferrum sp.]
MTPNIQQSVRFRTSPQALFDLYLDSRKHSRSTGAPARISRKVGGKFTAFGGKLAGKNLFLVPGKQIVQLWRATHWKKEDWSILVLNFSRVAGGAQIDLVHIGVPTYDHKGVREGWPKYYWRPWKKFLSK